MAMRCCSQGDSAGWYGNSHYRVNSWAGCVRCVRFDIVEESHETQTADEARIGNRTRNYRERKALADGGAGAAGFEVRRMFQRDRAGQRGAALLGLPQAEDQRLARYRTANAGSRVSDRAADALRLRPLVDEPGGDYILDGQSNRFK